MDPELLQRLLGQLGARPPGNTFGKRDALHMDQRVDQAFSLLRTDLRENDPEISGAINDLRELFDIDDWSGTPPERASILSEAVDAGLRESYQTAAVAASDSLANIMGIPAHAGLPARTKTGGSEAYLRLAGQAERMRAERDSVNARRNRAYDARNRARADSMDSIMEARRDSARMEKMPLEMQLLSQFLGMFGDS